MPDYPAPYEMFNTSLKHKPISEREKKWENCYQNNNTLSLIAEHKKEKSVGKFSLVEIDWEEMCVNNVGIRLHPHWCNKGYGTRLLKSISNWCFSNGIVKIRFDVLSSNQRAIRSYENAGYIITEKFECGNAIFY